MPGGPPEGRVLLLHGSLTYRDDRWADADAAALIEVIEHLDPDRLPLVERVVFGEARPARRRGDHPKRGIQRTLSEPSRRHLPPSATTDSNGRAPSFAAWADKIRSTYGYSAEFSGIGRNDKTLGSPTQMAVFTR